MKIGLFFQEITFIIEFPGSNFLLPTFLIGGKWDFQEANLLLATVNFESWRDGLITNTNITEFWYIYTTISKVLDLARNFIGILDSLQGTI